VGPSGFALDRVWVHPTLLGAQKHPRSLGPSTDNTDLHPGSIGSFRTFPDNIQIPALQVPGGLKTSWDAWPIATFRERDSAARGSEAQYTMSSAEEIAELRKMIVDQESRIRRLEALFETEKPVAAKKVSLKEFLLSKAPRSDVQKVLGIGYYLERNEGAAAFTVDDLRKAFRTAAEPLPGNLSETIRKNVSKGHLMDAGDKKNGSKAWILTSTGEKVVEAGFKTG